MKPMVLCVLVGLGLAATSFAGVSIDGVYGTNLGPGDGQPETRWSAEIQQAADPMTAGEVYYVYWWGYQARKGEESAGNGGATFILDADDNTGYDASAESVIQPLFPWTGTFEVKDWTFGDPEAPRTPSMNQGSLSREPRTTTSAGSWAIRPRIPRPSTPRATRATSTTRSTKSRPRIPGSTSTRTPADRIPGCSPPEATRTISWP